MQNVKTPTLVLHSDNDFRVPIEQGEQWFRALQHFGVPSEIVFFPRENHNLTRTGEPKHLVESLNWQVCWFERYINGNAGAPPRRRVLRRVRAPASTQDRPSDRKPMAEPPFCHAAIRPPINRRNEAGAKTRKEFGGAARMISLR